MSQENVETVRRGFEAFDSGDQVRQADLISEAVHPHFELHPLYFDRVYEGVAGVQEFISEMRDIWEEYALDLHEVIDMGERVVGVVRASGRGRGSGVPVDQELGVVFTFVGRKLIRTEAFASRVEALEAVGLRE